jgi:hypothetical protein
MWVDKYVQKVFKKQMDVGIAKASVAKAVLN